MYLCLVSFYRLLGLAGITLTGDAFNLYVLIEVAALTGYGLIALGSNRAAAATFTYVILGTIGASLYLLGVGYLYLKTGTLNMVGIHEAIQANELYSSARHAGSLYFGAPGHPDQNGFLPLSCLVAQELLPCPHHHILPVGSSGDQGDDLCNDPDGAQCIRGGVLI